MSKITPKNLSYDTSLPPFLARLQAAERSNDRHEFSIARPKKQRTAEDEAEDEPVYFNEESGETLTRSEWESKDAKESNFGEGEGVGAAIGGAPAELGRKEKEGENGAKEKVAGIGATRKRKAGKVVGGEEGEPEAEPDTKEMRGGKMAKTTTSKKDAKKGEKPKPARKAKKIKLSFDD